MREERKLKGLKSQLKLLEGDAEALKIELSAKQKEFSQKQKAIKSLKDTIEKINSSENLRVSEHAVLRYLERVKGISISDIEKEILSDQVVKLVDTLGGNGTYPNEGYSVVMKNYTVTTVIK